MAIEKVQKIELVALYKQKSKILDILQSFGSIQIDEIRDESEQETKDEKTLADLNELQKLELECANIDYAIKILTPYAAKKGFLGRPLVLSGKEITAKAEKCPYKKLLKECQDQEEIVQTCKNEISALKNEIEVFSPWEKMGIDLRNTEGSDNYGFIAGSVKTPSFQNTVKELGKLDDLISVEKVHQDEKDTLFTVVFLKELEKEIRAVLSNNKFAEMEFPVEKGLLKEYLHNTEEKITANEKNIAAAKKELTKIARKLDDLKVVHDYLAWQREKMEATQKFNNTQYSFVIRGWVPVKKLDEVEKALSKETKEFAIKKLQPGKDENPPVIIKNNRFMDPFETLTKMFGLPKYGAIEPTPFLSVFFVVFFALCLTDAAYGIIMFIMMFLMLKFMKMREGSQKLVRLLMYGGLVTAVIGALFGGWFGLLPEDMPEFLTYTSETGEKMFLLQTVNSISNPISVLILALSLGFIQILLGVYMKFIHDFRFDKKLDAVLDTGTWAYMLTGIGVFIVAAAGLLPEGFAEIAKWWVISGAVFLVLTQGRSNKNIIGKFLSGILSLYGLVNYMSDVLSYSRLLALGLATAIIALAVNVIVELLFGIPYVGWFFAIGVFVGGHLFNLLINALGSFIHSGRLQFVEFFGKFMEAGGKDFKPFSKKSKYVFLKEN